MRIAGIAMTAAVVLGLVAGAGTAQADTFNFRVAAGHPPGIIYVAMMQKEFVPRMKKRLEAMGHTVNVNEAYGGSLVKVAETLEGVQDGIVDIGAYCVCFEPSNLFLANWSLWLPFDPPTGTVAMKLGRAVHDFEPHMSKSYEGFNQRLLYLSGTDNYGLWTTFDWKSVADLKGQKMGAAGPNLPWVEKVGMVPVQLTAPEAYQAMLTGVAKGMILFPFDGVGMKYYEPAKYYTITNFGAKSTVSITANGNFWNKLPAPVQAAIVEVSKEVEAMTGPWIDETGKTSLALVTQNGANVRTITPEAQTAWAEALKDWPNEKAKEADARGLPGSRVMKFAVDEAERLGHKWPVKYPIK